MIRISALAILAGAAMALAGLPAAQGQDTIDWKTDVKKAFDEARRTQKPLWVLFR